MPRLREGPFYGLAPSHRIVVATEPHENRRAFPHESGAPPPARVAAVCLRAIALPARRALSQVACPRGNQKASPDSLFGNLDSVTLEVLARNDEVEGRRGI